MHSCLTWHVSEALKQILEAGNHTGDVVTSLADREGALIPAVGTDMFSGVD